MRVFRYQDAINIYEDLARQSLKHKSTYRVKYGVRGHLFNAGICHLSVKEMCLRPKMLWSVIRNCIQYFQELDLAAALDEEDVKFTDAAKKFDNITKLDAINIYEDLARQSLKHKSTYGVKYGVRGHLFNAGICHLCKGNVLKTKNALERYKELYPIFSGTRNYRLLADLAAALDEEDVVKFTDAAKKFDNITKLVIDLSGPFGSWNSGDDGMKSQQLPRGQYTKTYPTNFACLEFEKKAERKLSLWFLCGFKHNNAISLYEKAANCYKLAKSWDQAGAMYCKHEAAEAYDNAGRSYKRTNTKECIACLEQALNVFMEIGRLSMYAKYCKEIAELYEQEQNLEQAITYYDREVDLFEDEEATTYANQCKQKIAQFSAQLGQYQKAINIYEDLARQSLKNCLLTYEVRGHLLNAGICQLCRGAVLKITNALERYQELDPTFSGTREYKLLADLAAALDEEDDVKFTDAAKKFDNITRLKHSSSSAVPF
ncbi:hypothetical protein L1987_64253 [Smallanthus sonchifolius]|uniref:Uncharacterized protein n=1 Tax=Smallanthus sonchifolius TaxID=185202 RepID=A0ACB9CFU9_9ASTR|nr:hypothetical protein L1987_64253 [Smallanthus sonchifolius]